MKKRLLLALLALGSTSAHALYLCTSPEGKTSYQDMPCPARPTKSANNPLAAKTLTADVARDTVDRFFASFAERDQLAVSKYLASDFRMVSQDDAGKKRIFQRAQAEAMLESAAGALKKYKLDKRCAEPAADGDAFTVQCDLKEQWSVANRQGSASTRNLIRVKLENGYGVLASITEIPVKP
ncbi:hypothetical protein [Niveibacterium sp. SC-1]|uniref:hypothetical protein n=1 Tax=Niveibacterium sp. SC-1 TaxID=3135646 RepID=UPI00311E84CF